MLAFNLFLSLCIGVLKSLKNILLWTTAFKFMDYSV